MAVPVEITWTTGQVVTAAQLNANLRDAINFLLNPPLFIGRQSVVQSIGNASFIPLLLDVEDIDRDNGHSTVTNTSRYTCQTPGWYDSDGVAAWAPNNTGRRLVRWTVNGTAVNASRVDLPPVANTNQTAVPAAGRQIFLNTSDYLELGSLQDTGGALSTASAADIAPYMSLRWVSN